MERAESLELWLEYHLHQRLSLRHQKGCCKITVNYVAQPQVAIPAWRRHDEVQIASSWGVPEGWQDGHNGPWVTPLTLLLLFKLGWSRTKKHCHYLPFLSFIMVFFACHSYYSPLKSGVVGDKKRGEIVVNWVFFLEGLTGCDIRRVTHLSRCELFYTQPAER